MIKDIVDYICEAENPSDRQIFLFEELFKIFIEFPIPNEPPSSAAVVLASNSGAALPQAFAAGLNCISDQHLPIQQIATFISRNYTKEPKEVISKFKKRKIPGFGHPSIKGEDQRVLYLKNEFKDLINLHSKFCISLEEVMPVPMNIGCIIACLSLDNGIQPNNCLFLPLLGRMLGWLKIHNNTKNNFPKVVPSFNSVYNENI